MGKISVEDQVRAVLNPPLHEKYEEEGSNWNDFSLVSRDVIKTVNIVDLKGKKFRFPGSFKMERTGDEITFTAVAKQ